MRGSCVEDIKKIINVLSDHVIELLSMDASTLEEFALALKTKSYRRQNMRVASKSSTNTEAISIPSCRPSISEPEGSTLGRKLSILSKFSPTVFYDDDKDAEDDGRKSMSGAMREMSDVLRPNILKLIKKQRLSYMMHGHSFYKLDKMKHPRQSRKFVFVKLSSNHKLLYYKDMSICPKAGVKRDNTYSYFPVANITEVSTGINYRKWQSEMELHLESFIWLKDVQDSLKSKLEISISFKELSNDGMTVKDKVSCLQLVALDEKMFEYWRDGLNILRGKEAEGGTFFKKEYESLEIMELGMNLIDINKNNDLPKIPPPPPNYNFSRKYTELEERMTRCGKIQGETVASKK